MTTKFEDDEFFGDDDEWTVYESEPPTSIPDTTKPGNSNPTAIPSNPTASIPAGHSNPVAMTPTIPAGHSNPVAVTPMTEGFAMPITSSGQFLLPGTGGEKDFMIHSPMVRDNYNKAMHPVSEAPGSLHSEAPGSLHSEASRDYGVAYGTAKGSLLNRDSLEKGLVKGLSETMSSHLVQQKQGMINSLKQKLVATEKSSSSKDAEGSGKTGGDSVEKKNSNSGDKVKKLDTQFDTLGELHQKSITCMTVESSQRPSNAGQLLMNPTSSAGMGIVGIMGILNEHEVVNNSLSIIVKKPEEGVLGSRNHSDFTTSHLGSHLGTKVQSSNEVTHENTTTSNLQGGYVPPVTSHSMEMKSEDALTALRKAANVKKTKTTKVDKRKKPSENNVSLSKSSGTILNVGSNNSLSLATPNTTTSLRVQGNNNNIRANSFSIPDKKKDVDADIMGQNSRGNMRYQKRSSTVTKTDFTEFKIDSKKESGNKSGSKADGNIKTDQSLRIPMKKNFYETSLSDNSIINFDRVLKTDEVLREYVKQFKSEDIVEAVDSSKHENFSQKVDSNGRNDVRDVPHNKKDSHRYERSDGKQESSVTLRSKPQRAKSDKNVFNTKLPETKIESSKQITGGLEFPKNKITKQESNRQAAFNRDLNQKLSAWIRTNRDDRDDTRDDRDGETIESVAQLTTTSGGPIDEKTGEKSRTDKTGANAVRRSFSEMVPRQEIQVLSANKKSREERKSKLAEILDESDDSEDQKGLQQDEKGLQEDEQQKIKDPKSEPSNPGGTTMLGGNDKWTKITSEETIMDKKSTGEKTIDGREKTIDDKMTAKVSDVKSKPSEEKSTEKSKSDGKSKSDEKTKSDDRTKTVEERLDSSGTGKSSKEKSDQKTLSQGSEDKKISVEESRKDSLALEQDDLVKDVDKHGVGKISTEESIVVSKDTATAAKEAVGKESSGAKSENSLEKPVALVTKTDETPEKLIAKETETAIAAIPNDTAIVALVSISDAKNVTTLSSTEQSKAVLKTIILAEEATDEKATEIDAGKELGEKKEDHTAKELERLLRDSPKVTRDDLVIASKERTYHMDQRADDHHSKTRLGSDVPGCNTRPRSKEIISTDAQEAKDLADVLAARQAAEQEQQELIKADKILKEKRLAWLTSIDDSVLQRIYLECAASSIIPIGDKDPSKSRNFLGIKHIFSEYLLYPILISGLTVGLSYLVFEVDVENKQKCMPQSEYPGPDLASNVSLKKRSFFNHQSGPPSGDVIIYESGPLTGIEGGLFRLRGIPNEIAPKLYSFNSLGTFLDFLIASNGTPNLFYYAMMHSGLLANPFLMIFLPILILVGMDSFCSKKLKKMNDQKNEIRNASLVSRIGGSLSIHMDSKVGLPFVGSPLFPVKPLYLFLVLSTAVLGLLIHYSLCIILMERHNTHFAFFIGAVFILSWLAYRSLFGIYKTLAFLGIESSYQRMYEEQEKEGFVAIALRQSRHSMSASLGGGYGVNGRTSSNSQPLNAGYSVNGKRPSINSTRNPLETLGRKNSLTSADFRFPREGGHRAAADKSPSGNANSQFLADSIANSLANTVAKEGNHTTVGSSADRSADHQQNFPASTSSNIDETFIGKLQGMILQRTSQNDGEMAPMASLATGYHQSMHSGYSNSSVGSSGCNKFSMSSKAQSTGIEGGYNRFENSIQNLPHRFLQSHKLMQAGMNVGRSLLYLFLWFICGTYIMVLCCTTIYPSMTVRKNRGSPIDGNEEPSNGTIGNGILECLFLSIFYFVLLASWSKFSFELIDRLAVAIAFFSYDFIHLTRGKENPLVTTTFLTFQWRRHNFFLTMFFAVDFARFAFGRLLLLQVTSQTLFMVLVSVDLFYHLYKFGFFPSSEKNLLACFQNQFKTGSTTSIQNNGDSEERGPGTGYVHRNPHTMVGTSDPTTSRETRKPQTLNDGMSHSTASDRKITTTGTPQHTAQQPQTLNDGMSMMHNSYSHGSYRSDKSERNAFSSASSSSAQVRRVLDQALQAILDPSPILYQEVVDLSEYMLAPLEVMLKESAERITDIGMSDDSSDNIYSGTNYTPNATRVSATSANELVEIALSQLLTDEQFFDLQKVCQKESHAQTMMSEADSRLNNRRSSSKDSEKAIVGVIGGNSVSAIEMGKKRHSVLALVRQANGGAASRENTESPPAGCQATDKATLKTTLSIEQETGIYNEKRQKLLHALVGPLSNLNTMEIAREILASGSSGREYDPSVNSVFQMKVCGVDFHIRASEELLLWIRDEVGFEYTREDGTTKNMAGKLISGISNTPGSDTLKSSASMFSVVSTKDHSIITRKSGSMRDITSRSPSMIQYDSVLAALNNQVQSNLRSGGGPNFGTKQSRDSVKRNSLFSVGMFGSFQMHNAPNKSASSPFLKGSSSLKISQGKKVGGSGSIKGLNLSYLQELAAKKAGIAITDRDSTEFLGEDEEREGGDQFPSGGDAEPAAEPAAKVYVPAPFVEDNSTSSSSSSENDEFSDNESEKSTGVGRNSLYHSQVRRTSVLSVFSGVPTPGAGSRSPWDQGQRSPWDQGQRSPWDQGSAQPSPFGQGPNSGSPYGQGGFSPYYQNSVRNSAANSARTSIADRNISMQDYGFHSQEDKSRHSSPHGVGSISNRTSQQVSNVSNSRPSQQSPGMLGPNVAPGMTAAASNMGNANVGHVPGPARRMSELLVPDWQRSQNRAKTSGTMVAGPLSGTLRNSSGTGGLPAIPSGTAVQHQGSTTSACAVSAFTNAAGTNMPNRPPRMRANSISYAPNPNAIRRESKIFQNASLLFGQRGAASVFDEVLDEEVERAKIMQGYRGGRRDSQGSVMSVSSSSSSSSETEKSAWDLLGKNPNIATTKAAAAVAAAGMSGGVQSGGAQTTAGNTLGIAKQASTGAMSARSAPAGTTAAGCITAAKKDVGMTKTASIQSNHTIAESHDSSPTNLNTGVNAKQTDNIPRQADSTSNTTANQASIKKTATIDSLKESPRSENVEEGAPSAAAPSPGETSGKEMTQMLDTLKKVASIKPNPVERDDETATTGVIIKSESAGNHAPPTSPRPPTTEPCANEEVIGQAQPQTLGMGSLASGRASLPAQDIPSPINEDPENPSRASSKQQQRDYDAYYGNEKPPDILSSSSSDLVDVPTDKPFVIQTSNYRHGVTPGEGGEAKVMSGKSIGDAGDVSPLIPLRPGGRSIAALERGNSNQFNSGGAPIPLSQVANGVIPGMQGGQIGNAPVAFSVFSNTAKKDGEDGGDDYEPAPFREDSETSSDAPLPEYHASYSYYKQHQEYISSLERAGLGGEDHGTVNEPGYYSPQSSRFGVHHSGEMSNGGGHGGNQNQGHQGQGLSRPSFGGRKSLGIPTQFGSRNNEIKADAARKSLGVSYALLGDSALPPSGNNSRQPSKQVYVDGKSPSKDGNRTASKKDGKDGKNPFGEHENEIERIKSTESDAPTEPSYVPSYVPDHPNTESGNPSSGEPSPRNSNVVFAKEDSTASNNKSGSKKLNFFEQKQESQMNEGGIGTKDSVKEQNSDPSTEEESEVNNPLSDNNMRESSGVVVGDKTHNSGGFVSAIKSFGMGKQTLVDEYIPKEGRRFSISIVRQATEKKVPDRKSRKSEKTLFEQHSSGSKRSSRQGSEKQGGSNRGSTQGSNQPSRQVSNQPSRSASKESHTSKRSERSVQISKKSKGMKGGNGIQDGSGKIPSGSSGGKIPSGSSGGKIPSGSSGKNISDASNGNKKIVQMRTSPALELEKTTTGATNLRHYKQRQSLPNLLALPNNDRAKIGKNKSERGKTAKVVGDSAKGDKNEAFTPSSDMSRSVDVSDMSDGENSRATQQSHVQDGGDAPNRQSHSQSRIKEKNSISGHSSRTSLLRKLFGGGGTSGRSSWFGTENSGCQTGTTSVPASVPVSAMNSTTPLDYVSSIKKGDGIKRTGSSPNAVGKTVSIHANSINNSSSMTKNQIMMGKSVSIKSHTSSMDDSNSTGVPTDSAFMSPQRPSPFFDSSGYTSGIHSGRHSGLHSGMQSGMHSGRNSALHSGMISKGMSSARHSASGIGTPSTLSQKQSGYEEHHTGHHHGHGHHDHGHRPQPPSSKVFSSFLGKVFGYTHSGGSPQQQLSGSPSPGTSPFVNAQSQLASQVVSHAASAVEEDLVLHVTKLASVTSVKSENTALGRKPKTEAGYKRFSMPDSLGEKGERVGKKRSRRKSSDSAGDLSDIEEKHEEGQAGGVETGGETNLPILPGQVVVPTSTEILLKINKEDKSPLKSPSIGSAPPQFGKGSRKEERKIEGRRKTSQQFWLNGLEDRVKDPAFNAAMVPGLHNSSGNDAAMVPKVKRDGSVRDGSIKQKKKYVGSSREKEVYFSPVQKNVQIQNRLLSPFFLIVSIARAHLVERYRIRALVKLILGVLYFMIPVLVFQKRGNQNHHITLVQVNYDSNYDVSHDTKILVAFQSTTRGSTTKKTSNYKTINTNVNAFFHRVFRADRSRRRKSSLDATNDTIINKVQSDQNHDQNDHRNDPSNAIFNLLPSSYYSLHERFADRLMTCLILDGIEIVLIIFLMIFFWSDPTTTGRSLTQRILGQLNLPFHLLRLQALTKARKHFLWRVLFATKETLTQFEQGRFFQEDLGYYYDGLIYDDQNDNQKDHNVGLGIMGAGSSHHQLLLNKNTLKNSESIHEKHSNKTPKNERDKNLHSKLLLRWGKLLAVVEIDYKSRSFRGRILFVVAVVLFTMCLVFNALWSPIFVNDCGITENSLLDNGFICEEMRKRVVEKCT